MNAIPFGVAWLAIASAVFAACPAHSGGSGGPDDPMGSRTLATAPVLASHTETLANGLRVVVVSAVSGVSAMSAMSGDSTARHRPGRPLAPTAGLIVPFDPAAEPVGLEGAAAVLVHLAVAGTDRDTEHGSPSARALALGATLEVVHDGAALGWLATGQPAPESNGPNGAPEAPDPNDANPLLQIILDVAIAPELPGTALASDADRWRARLEASPDLAADAAARWSAALALGLGRPVGVAPTALALGDIHREAIIRVHRRLIRPERAVVVVTTPLSPALRARLTAWRADSMQGTPPDQPCPAPRWAGEGRASYALRAPDEDGVASALPIPGVADAGRAAWDAFAARAAIFPAPVGFEFALRDLGEHAAVALRWSPLATAPRDAAWHAWLGRIAASFRALPARAPVATTPLAAARHALWKATDDHIPRAPIPPGPDPIPPDLGPVFAALDREAWTLELAVADVPPPGAIPITRDRALCAAPTDSPPTSPDSSP